MVSLPAQQLSNKATQQHFNPAGQKLTKKKKAAAAAQQLSSPAAWQLSRKETTTQHLSRTEDRYCRILTDSVSLVSSLFTKQTFEVNNKISFKVHPYNFFCPNL